MRILSQEGFIYRPYANTKDFVGLFGNCKDINFIDIGLDFLIADRDFGASDIMEPGDFFDCTQQELYDISNTTCCIDKFGSIDKIKNWELPTIEDIKKLKNINYKGIKASDNIHYIGIKFWLDNVENSVSFPYSGVYGKYERMETVEAYYGIISQDISNEYITIAHTSPNEIRRYRKGIIYLLAVIKCKNNHFYLLILLDYI